MSRLYVKYAQVYDILTKRLFFPCFDKDLHKKLTKHVNNVNNYVNNPIFQGFSCENNVNNLIYHLLCQTMSKSGGFV